MQLRLAMAAIGIVIGLVACKNRDSGPKRDPHSYAQPDRVAVKHLDLTLNVDFTTKQLSGTARFQLARTDPSAPLILDIEKLAIGKVSDCAGGELRPSVSTPGKMGERLVIASRGDCVEIAYVSSPDASALLWVEPSGTAGGAKPMLFTQSQATHARSWIPLQDSPSVRFTYTAKITVPDGMRPLMSAENPKAPEGKVWMFKQPHPIPSYLMALAVGDFAFAPTGPRSGVWSEPSVVSAAASEFVEVETMMTAAEELYGPYRWGRYDMLVLPPSFPFGGMENPNLTFLTPTVITGDRALVSLIAHELAHSWSGNLATNSTWNDVWLNEGFTTYVELRIMEKLRGVEYSDVHWHGVKAAIDRVIGESGPDSPRSRLAHDYGAGTAPDDIPGDLAYDKGALFLRTLEHAYGRDVFDKFLRGWFDRHAFTSVDTKTFITEATAQLGTKVDLKKWAYGTGLPADAAPTTSARATKLGELATAFAQAGTEPDAKGWTTLDWTVFLRALPKDITPERIRALDARFALTGTANAEIAMYWLPKVIKADAQDKASAVQAFLTTVGRRRMVVPVVEAMVATNAFWKQLAQTTFDQAKARYHPITRDTIAKLLAGG